MVGKYGRATLSSVDSLPQMVTTSGSGPGRRQNGGTPCLMWVAKTKVVRPPPQCLGTGLEAVLSVLTLAFQYEMQASQAVA